MPITLKKTYRLIVADNVIINGKKKEPKKNYAQTVKVETKSNTIKVLR